MQKLVLLEAYLKENFNFSDKELLIIQGLFEYKQYKRNEIILNEGEVCKYLYFVQKGLLRTFHIVKNDGEFTRLFAPEGKFCTVLSSFQHAVKSPASIQALEDTDVLRISYANFSQFISVSLDARKVYTDILEEFQNFQIGRLEFLTRYSISERIEIFHRENSDLAERVTDKIIATYLQIAPETYSRQKKR